ncbi:M61 family metallopeptidase [Thalassotalea sp. LPB0316]|uniref:M61 family metallopeptidase n=1 Tax=Thalassotalea sp. LPB0316 TaxID=2769490 RepID=UPI0018686E52|nr:PDZ domain-containing protein [Thalassotalea sp. LPB0316]QOL26183.1 M61 family metallopeptidase [Thalassotalea sp. LPB0316]
MSTIEYRITPENLNSHLFRVDIKADLTPNQTYTLSLPAWLPGSYMIRDFAKNIIDLAIRDEKDLPVSFTRVDKQTWRFIAPTAKVTISYQVYAFDLSVRTAYLDSQRGFFNGSSTFLSIAELASQPCQVMIELGGNDHWQVATGLTRDENTSLYSAGLYHATDYQHLIDCPVAIGDFDVTEFDVNGIPHYLVFTSEHFGDRQRMVRDISKLCQHHIELFGEAPFSEYWFITHLQAVGFGGLEHKNSTVLQAGRFDLPNPQYPEELSESYKTFLSLCSHEYFHAWNVCRLKPREFIPYDLSQEVYTEQLWAFEGITSYYDDFSLQRAGIISIEEYLAILSKGATRVYRGPGEYKQSIVESSFYAWTKFYQQGPDAANNIVSYYTKGALFALWLDFTIREMSSGQKSLDDLMRAMWQKFGRAEQGTTTQDYLEEFNKLCGQDMSEAFYERLNAKAPYQLSDQFAKFGVRFSRAKFDKLNSLDTAVTNDIKPYIGAMFQQLPEGLKITSVIEHSPAANAGLAVNDVLIAVAGRKVNETSLAKLLSHHPVGKRLSCYYFRDDLLIESELVVSDSPLAGVKLTLENSDLARAWFELN